MHAHLDTGVFTGDPRTARGLPFTDVTIHDDGGDAPAWYVPPTASPARTTWVIAVHGRGGTRQEALRVLPTIAAAGAPTLVVTYRNDVGAPRSPDGYYHLGDTEWRDVAAAVRYARDHGATGVVLYGWSMGGAVVMTTIRRLPPADAALVRGAVLDCPVLDWNATLDLQASQRSLPEFLTWTAERVVEQRAHLSLDDFDQVDRAGTFTTPFLLFVDRSDSTVPPGPSLRFAAARPDLVTLVTTSGGDHTRSWNVDPTGYESAVAGFLTAHG
nr:alpha/beta fold hydrolase [Planosporangium thailandense]